MDWLKKSIFGAYMNMPKRVATAVFCFGVNTHPNFRNVGTCQHVPPFRSLVTRRPAPFRRKWFRLNLKIPFWLKYSSFEARTVTVDTRRYSEVRDGGGMNQSSEVAAQLGAL